EHGDRFLLATRGPGGAAQVESDRTVGEAVRASRRDRRRPPGAAVRHPVRGRATFEIVLAVTGHEAGELESGRARRLGATLLAQDLVAIQPSRCVIAEARRGTGQNGDLRA